MFAAIQIAPVRLVLVFCPLVVLASFVLSGSASAADSWPQWRGPQGQGHAAARNLPLTWSEVENVAWKTKIPGRGWSSPVIEDGVIWLTTALETKAAETERVKRLKSNTGDQPLTVADKVSFRAVGVDLQTGRLLHDIELFNQHQPQWVHAINSYASPTPVVDNGRLYCHFGTFGTVALDTLDGKLLWRNHELRIMHENGPGSSPLLWRNLVIVHCDGSDEQYIVALDQKTGKVVWKTDRSGKLPDNIQLKKAYCTPLIATIEGRELLLSPAADWLYGYDPSTGHELWKLSYGVLGFSNVPRPVMQDDTIYLSTGFMEAQMLAVRLSGPAGAGNQRITWRYRKQVSKVPSPLLVDQQLYFVSDNGVATCLDVQDGRPLWVKRLGGKFVASPLYADGRIYFYNRSGTTFVLRPGRQYQLLATNKLATGIWASPAAVDRALYVRTEEALYRLQLSTDSSAGDR